MDNEIEKLLSLINEDNNLLDKIQEYANKLMPIPDIAILLDLDDDMLALAIRYGDNPIAMAYKKGKALRVLAIHESEISLADAGSSQGMDNLHSFLQQMNAAEY